MQRAFYEQSCNAFCRMLPESPTPLLLAPLTTHTRAPLSVTPPRAPSKQTVSRHRRPLLIDPGIHAGVAPLCCRASVIAGCTVRGPMLITRIRIAGLPPDPAAPEHGGVQVTVRPAMRLVWRGMDTADLGPSLSGLWLRSNRSPASVLRRCVLHASCGSTVVSAGAAWVRVWRSRGGHPATG